MRLKIQILGKHSYSKNAYNIIATKYSKKLADYLQRYDFIDEDLKFILTHWNIFENTHKDFISLLSYMKDKYYKDGVFKYYLVIVKKKGEFFGELALINNKPRAATIAAKTDTI